ncbi:MAG: SCP2 sterol-binding domain-containing protein [Candidatus Accumulibacter sp.]|nr:SCP2 sterol-binding domain-containing protein [Accumulibacter sp.]
MADGFCKAFTIPGFALPSLVARVGARLPQWPHAVALAAGFNAVVRMGLLPGENLALLENRSFLIDVLDTGCRAAFTFRDGRFRPLFSVPDAPDLAFRANLSAFLQIAARQEDPDTLFFKRALSVEGDTELGLVVKNMLDAVEWPRFPGMAAPPLIRR